MMMTLLLSIYITSKNNFFYLLWYSFGKLYHQDRNANKHYAYKSQSTYLYFYPWSS